MGNFNVKKFQSEAQMNRDAEHILEHILKRQRWGAAVRDRLANALSQVRDGIPLRPTQRGPKRPRRKDS